MTGINKVIQGGTPLTGGQKATGRPSAEYLSFLAKRLGRCGDIHPLTGHVCVTQPHNIEVEHMAIQIGGPLDGHVYATWGGVKPNTNTGITHQTKPRQAGKSPLIISGRQAGKTTKAKQYNE
jgi:hypothetical protein